MFDMATISMGANLMSPMTGASVSMMGSMTPSADMKYSSVPSPHSPMSTPGSTPNSTFSNGGKSVSNSNSKDWDLLGNENELFGSKCKRKINFAHIGLPKGHLPQTVARRNARERNRVKQVNNGFAALKQHIPLGHRSKKMSKVETLKCAVDYIKNLKTMLDLNGALSSSSTPSSSSGNESNDVNHHFGPNNASEFVSSGDPLGHYHHHHHPQHFGTSSASSSTVPAGSHQLSPSSSDDPSSPSYASEASYITSSNNNNNNNNANMYDFEKYEPVSPEDEELLDAISWWQQS